MALARIARWTLLCGVLVLPAAAQDATPGAAPAPARATTAAPAAPPATAARSGLPEATLAGPARQGGAPSPNADICPAFGRWLATHTQPNAELKSNDALFRQLMELKATQASLPLRAVNLEVFGASSWLDHSVQRFEIAIPEALNNDRLELLPFLVWHRPEAAGSDLVQRATVERLEDAREAVPGGAATDRRRTLKLEIAMPGSLYSAAWWPTPHPASVVIIGCRNGEAVFVAARRASIIALAPAQWVAIIGLILVYLAAALISPGSRLVRESPDASRGLKLRSWFDPVLITQDEVGFGSLRRLQLFYFTFVIFGLSLYILLRAGYLSAISEQLLWLMGIAASGTAFASLADRLRTPEPGGAPLRGPSRELLRFLALSGVMARRDQFGSWLDVVTEGPGLAVHRLQVLIFSGLVGVFIVSQGSESLAALKIPDSYLMLIGLSQAVYVSVYATSPHHDWGPLHDAAAAFRAAVPDWETRVGPGRDAGATPLTAAEREAYLALRNQAARILPHMAPES